MDTLSNGVFLIVAVAGWLAMRQAPTIAPGTRMALHTLCLGLVCTCLGSGVYHAWPSAFTLVLDRLGMAVAFAGVLGLALAGHLCGASARATTTPLLTTLLAAAGLAAVLPWAMNNLLPWIVVQFGGVLLLLWAAWAPSASSELRVRYGWVVAWYALAKAFEANDEAIFRWTHEWVSGHTLKHVAAALAAWPVVSAVLHNGRKQKR
jgi:hypothetical protein